MLKRIALLGAMAALTIVKPSNAVAQGWDGWDRRPDFCCERRFFPRRVFCCEERREFCCEERRFFRRREFCCEERRFFPRRVFCCEERRERRFFRRREFCCEERRVFARPFWRRPSYYGDSFGGYGYDWNADYTDAGYGYNEY